MADTVARARSFPPTVQLDGLEVSFRLMTAADRDAILAFSAALPEHDLHFLRHDITQPEAVDEWLRYIARERTRTLLAESGGEIVGYASLHHNATLWSRHLGEIRLMVAPAFRGRGLGRELAERVFAFGRELGLFKLTAQMMSNQRQAQDLFHRLGFIPEALLHDWTIDRKGRTHDLIIMSREVEEVV